MVHTIPDITGNGTAIALGTKLVAGQPSKANWIQFTVPLAGNGATGTNSNMVRAGEGKVSATQGAAVGLSGLLFPPISDGVYIDLNQINVFVASNDKVQVTYGTL